MGRHGKSKRSQPECHPSCRTASTGWIADEAALVSQNAAPWNRRNSTPSRVLGLAEDSMPGMTPCGYAPSSSSHNFRHDHSRAGPDGGYLATFIQH